MINFAYFLFFIMLNGYTYILISKSYILDNRIKYGILGLFISIILVHEIGLDFLFLMNSVDFYRIFIFSLVLAGFFFFNKFLILRMESKKKKFNSFNNFIYIMTKRNVIYILFYVLTTLYQTLAVFNKNFR